MTFALNKKGKRESEKHRVRAAGEIGALKKKRRAGKNSG